MGRPRVPVVRRLLTKVLPNLATGCWTWTGEPNLKGYGTFWLDKKNKLAHRVVYEHYRGAIPEGLELDHLCRNRICVNPWHLEPVTSQVNLLRGDTIAARLAAQTSCIWGHPLDESNTYPARVRGKVYRACRRCKTVKARVYRAAKKGVPLSHEEADSWK